MRALLLVLLLLCACSAEKRLYRLIKRNPGLVKTDTIFRSDTTIIPEYSKDTVFVPGRDTVIIREGKLTVKYFHTDSVVYLSGKCDSTKDIKKRAVLVKSVPLIKVVKEIPQYIKWVIAALVGCFIALFLTRPKAK